MLLVADGKGGKQRIVPLPPVVVEALEAARGNDWVIPRPANGRMNAVPGPNTANAISKLAGRYLAELGTPHRLHSLRHRYATALYRDTTDLRLVQGLLGHTNPATTARYAAYAPDKAHAAAMRITSLERVG